MSRAARVISESGVYHIPSATGDVPVFAHFDCTSSLTPFKEKLTGMKKER